VEALIQEIRMHRWRSLAVLAVALLCLMLFGQNTQAQQTKPSEPGGSASGKKPPIDDEDVIVRPKGKGFGKKSGDQGSKIYPFGFEWSHDEVGLKKGKKGEFRCDLYQNLTTLQAALMAGGDLKDAAAVNFDLEGFVFEVIQTKDGHFVWYIPDTTPKPCKKGYCVDSGVPPEYMDGKTKDGTIMARFGDSLEWVEVEEVLMRGKACQ
jgi:hypothetical protein